MPDVLDWYNQNLGGPDIMGPAGAPDATTAGPDVLSWLGNYIRNTTPANIAANLPTSYYDPSRSFAQNALDPRAIDQAANIALGLGGGGLGIKAYHGSPYDFNAFDASKIGTGEGAQAYGHGLYFAENEGVARGYRDTLSSMSNASYAGEITPDIRRGLDILNSVGASKRWEVEPQQLHEHLLRNYQDTFNSNLADKNIVGGRADLAEKIAALRSIDPSKLNAPGKMYEVNINAEPHRFLDWDQPLSQQSQKVQDIIKGRTDWTTPDMTGQQIYGSMIDRASPTGVSRQLNDWGIPGVRYLDQGSRGAGEGTSNYVMFDPARIEILRKYGLLPPAVAVGGLAGLGGTNGGS
jgi:hypothetical protein